MRPKTVISTQKTVDIHPYVQGRLRAIPRQEECAGILLGSQENGVTHISGFKRVPSNALRQAASEAGPTLAGFFRLRTAEAPALLASELELCRQTQPLFLLLNAGTGAVDSAIICRPAPGGGATRETLSLASPRPPAPVAPVPPARQAPSLLPWVVVGCAAVLTAAAAFHLWTAQPTAELSLDLQSRAGELSAVWRQTGRATAPVQSAALTIQDGATEQTMDLTPAFTPDGRVVLRPHGSTIAVTLKVRYKDGEQITRSTTYVGFDPVIVKAPPPPPDTGGLQSELIALRKRNKELMDAVTAMRKHFAQ